MMDEHKGEAVLVRLAGGSPLLRRGDAWHQSRRRVDSGVVNYLARAELLEVSAGSAQLTEVGRAKVERLLSPDRPQAWLVDRGRDARATVRENLAESPLGWLRRRDMITARQFEAGERLRADFMMAGRAPRITMCWSGMPRQGGWSAAQLDPSETQIAARQRFEGAVRAAGAGLADVLERVVCLGEGLTTAERSLGWPARAGKVVLTIALDRLAEHYAGGRG